MTAYSVAHDQIQLNVLPSTIEGIKKTITHKKKWRPFSHSHFFMLMRGFQLIEENSFQMPK